MDVPAVIVSVASCVVSVLSALIAVRALRTQRLVAAQQTLFAVSQKARDMVADHPELLQLHGISEATVAGLGVSKQETAYLIMSFVSGEAFYRLMDPPEIVFTDYRKALLDNPKVKLVWEKVIRKRLVSSGKFLDAVDCYYKIAEPSAAPDPAA